jgi:hypothetical protein
MDTPKIPTPRSLQAKDSPGTLSELPV